MSGHPILNKGTVFNAEFFLKKRYDRSSTAEVLFVGYAAPGTAESDAGWLIVRNSFDGDVKLPDGTYPISSIDFADGTKEFDKIWTNRINYSYE
jgi:hypothetical protein